MATQAHCAYCFETLAASLEKRPALSLHKVEALWESYSSTAREADSAAKPAAISRLLAPSSAGSSSPSSGGSSTPNSTSTTSSSLLSKLTGQASKSPEDDDDDDDEPEPEYPLFVTWNTLRGAHDKRLRGCIGTFSPSPLSSALASYALTSAFDDTRFSPISLAELPSLECAVTLLTDFEPARDVYDWDIGTHGLRISFKDKGRKLGATYLPDVALEQGWSKEEALVSLMRKAGWSGRKERWEEVQIEVVRYQGKKVGLAWKEWKAWRKWVDEELDGGR